jgi:hypothetical protein
MIDLIDKNNHNSNILSDLKTKLEKDRLNFQKLNRSLNITKNSDLTNVYNAKIEYINELIVFILRNE